MIWVAIVLLAAGLLTFWSGLRGRRIDDHPVCRRCRFDLVGLVGAPGGACPECGSVLEGRAVRIGNRDRGWVRAGTGVVVLVAALGLCAAWAWGRATGFDWNTVKPTAWLRYDVQNSIDPAAAVASAAELIKRVKDGRAEPTAAAPVVERALANQLAARQRANIDGFFAVPRDELDQRLDIFDTAATLGVVTPAQAVRYVDQSIRCTAQLRRRAAAGRIMTIECFAADGLGISSPKCPLMKQWGLTSCTVAGRELETEVDYVGGGKMDVRVRAPDLPPGEYSLKLTWRLDVSHALATGAGSMTMVPAGSIVRKFDAELRIEAAGTEVVAARTDEALAAAMAASIQGVRLVLEDDLDPPFLNVLFEVHDPAVPIVGSVWLERQGRRWPAGRIDIDHARGGAEFVALVEEAPGGLAGGEVSLVISPDRARATETKSLVEELWGREIVLPGVRLERRSGMVGE